jgi:uncharacterized protein YacL
MEKVDSSNKKIKKEKKNSAKKVVSRTAKKSRAAPKSRVVLPEELVELPVVETDNLATIPQKDLRHFARGVTSPIVEGIMLPPKVAMQIADEVVKRLRPRKLDVQDEKDAEPKIQRALFLDTSAILDERLFELFRIGVFWGEIVIIEPVLSELKHIADFKEDLKKERGRRALKALDQVKKIKDIHITVLKDEDKETEAVDDKIIHAAEKYKGRIVTGDYNLSQKAKISGVTSIDLHEVANALKTQAIPGEEFWVKVIQAGKGEGQGVGYLPDGTMIVVEHGISLKGKTIKVVVSRIIQTEAGKILFSQVSPDQTATAVM